MKRFIITALVLGSSLALPAVASADSGNYTTDDGPSCSWNGSGNFATVECSGYSRSAGTFVSYSCSLNFLGSSESWNCRDINGNTWSGHN